MQDWQKTIVEFLIRYGFQIVGAVITLVIGIMIARWVGNLLARWLEGKHLEPPVRILLVRVARLLIMAVVLLLVLDKFGVQIAPLVAGLGVVGVGVGLAMQGVLGNLVSGLLIIFTKPFRVGEYIELLNVHGQVIQIELFSTVLTHADRSRVVIPNRKIVGEILHNYGNVRQLDLSVGVGYSTRIEDAMAIIGDILQANRRVLKEPAPICGIATLADCSIVISIRPWTTVADFGPAGGEIYQAVIERFREKGIEIPFPQREIRVLAGGSMAAS